MLRLALPLIFVCTISFLGCRSAQNSAPSETVTVKDGKVFVVIPKLDKVFVRKCPDYTSIQVVAEIETKCPEIREGAVVTNQREFGAQQFSELLGTAIAVNAPYYTNVSVTYDPKLAKDQPTDEILQSIKTLREFAKNVPNEANSAKQRLNELETKYLGKNIKKERVLAEFSNLRNEIVADLAKSGSIVSYEYSSNPFSVDAISFVYYLNLANIKTYYFSTMDYDKKDAQFPRTVRYSFGAFPTGANSFYLSSSDAIFEVDITTNKIRTLMERDLGNHEIAVTPIKLADKNLYYLFGDSIVKMDGNKTETLPLPRANASFNKISPMRNPNKILVQVYSRVDGEGSKFAIYDIRSKQMSPFLIPQSEVKFNFFELFDELPEDKFLAAADDFLDKNAIGYFDYGTGRFEELWTSDKGTKLKLLKIDDNKVLVLSKNQLFTLDLMTKTKRTLAEFPLEGKSYGEEFNGKDLIRLGDNKFAVFFERVFCVFSL